MDSPTPLEYWRLLVSDEGSLPLFEAALSIAQDEYPALDLAEPLRQVDEFAARLRRRLPADASMSYRLTSLNHLFFQELGFHGNHDDYYDPDNSYLNRVIERRLGLPITLSLLYIEIGRQAGIPVQGVSFPGHYLVKARVGAGEVFIDVFNGGGSLSYADLAGRLESVLEPGVQFNELLTAYLQPATGRVTLARTLRNLKGLYLQRQDWPRLLAVQQRLVVLLPDDPAERRDRGVTWAQMECPRAAIEDFEAYLAAMPAAEDGDILREHILALRGTVSRFN